MVDSIPQAVDAVDGFDELMWLSAQVGNPFDRVASHRYRRLGSRLGRRNLHVPNDS